jgi:hypothetical protein
MIETPHLAPFSLLPPPAGTCQVCAVQHDPKQPHNKQSLFYQTLFYGQHGRWPTWADALAHCEDGIKAVWTAELRKHGVSLHCLSAETTIKPNHGRPQ